jgi:hypothetical protein
MSKTDQKMIRDVNQENAFLPADHKLLEKMQQTLKKQLEQEKSKLQMEYITKFQNHEQIEREK